MKEFYRNLSNENRKETNFLVKLFVSLFSKDKEMQQMIVERGNERNKNFDEELEYIEQDKQIRIEKYRNIANSNVSTEEFVKLLTEEEM